MKDALSYILSSIVDNPDKVQIDETEENGSVQLNITVAKEDMGKVIGKNGKVIRSIRNVLKIPAIKYGKKVTISLIDQQ